MIKLIVTDLDGTFLNTDSSYDPIFFDEVLKEIKSQGITFVACTGKQCERVEKLFNGQDKDMWILGDSATRIKKNGKVIKDFPIHKELALKSIKAIESFDKPLTTIVCTSKAAYVNSDIRERELQVVKNSYERVETIDSFKAIQENILKITVFDWNGRSDELRNHIEKDLQNTIYIVDSEPNWLDITAIGVHKGETVRAIQSMLNVLPQETMTFGDGKNDVELMEVAEYSFAMRNACESTKSAARFITASNDENGVLDTIQKILRLQR